MVVEFVRIHFYAKTNLCVMLPVYEIVKLYICMERKYKSFGIRKLFIAELNFEPASVHLCKMNLNQTFNSSQLYQMFKRVQNGLKTSQ
jgi:hypothetical protein